MAMRSSGSKSDLIKVLKDETDVQVSKKYLKMVIVHLLLYLMQVVLFIAPPSRNIQMNILWEVQKSWKTKSWALLQMRQTQFISAVIATGTQAWHISHGQITWERKQRYKAAWSRKPLRCTRLKRLLLKRLEQIPTPDFSVKLFVWSQKESSFMGLKSFFIGGEFQERSQVCNFSS